MDKIYLILLIPIIFGCFAVILLHDSWVRHYNDDMQDSCETLQRYIQHDMERNKNTVFGILNTEKDAFKDKGC